MSKTVWFSAFIACVVLLGSGYAYRKLALQLDALVKDPILPTLPLSVLPYKIGDWEGEDQSLRETVLEVAGNDDYINRVYRLKNSDYFVNLYVAFTGQPRTMLGHRPEVCYVGAGWILEQKEELEIPLDQGGSMPVLLHYFRKPHPETIRLMVLNYYIINGNATRDHRDFSGLLWRLPTFSRTQIRYIAQVQFSSTSSTALMSFVPEAAPLIAPLMPVNNGLAEVE